MLKAENISFSYRKKRVFEDKSYCFDNQNIYFLNWKNGVGKTTLLRLLSGYLICDNGFVQSDGHTVSVLKPLFPLELQTSLRSCFTIVKSLLDLRQVDFDSFFSEYRKFFDFHESNHFGELSEGQKAFFFLLLILRSQAQNFIIDELLSTLDLEKRTYIFDILLALKKQGKCIIIVDHVLDDSNLVSDNVHVVPYL